MGWLLTKHLEWCRVEFKWVLSGGGVLCILHWGGLRVGVGLVTSQYVRRGGVLHGGWGWILTSHCEEMGWGMWWWGIGYLLHTG